jgi:hypothetical protein
MVANLSEARSHNVAPELFLKHFREIRDCQRAHEDSGMALARAKKSAKTSGIDMDALKMLERLAKKDDDEVEVQLRHAREYAVWLDMPLGTQLGLFAPKLVDLPVAAVKHGTKETQKIWEAGAQGLKAGRDGEGAMDNPYPAGTPGFVEWSKQHTLGLAERATAARMGEDTEDERPADIAPATRRGKPAAPRGAKAQAALDKARSHLGGSALN